MRSQCPSESRVIEGPPPGNYFRVYSGGKFLPNWMGTIESGGVTRSREPSSSHLNAILSEVKTRLWCRRPSVTSTRKSAIPKMRRRRSSPYQIFPENFPKMYSTRHNLSAVELLTRIHSDLSTGKDSILLDSFAGTGTTAQAVLATQQRRRRQPQIHPDGVRRLRRHHHRRACAPSDQVAFRLRRTKTLKNGLGGSFTYCTLGDEISS